MAIITTNSNFSKEKKCCYKNENYSVRDNGAVLRNQINSKRIRPLDNNWTFGKLNIKTGYLEIASVSIHRIVATAFHGNPPSKEYVVDHIDTNKQNNRPENLRWVTRLENILLNPITFKRIEINCGSVEKFLEDPSKFLDKFSEPSHKWMCTVSKEEAQESKERLLNWAKSDKELQGGTLGEWIFRRQINIDSIISKPISEPMLTNYIISKTPNAAQRIIFKNDKPNEYPSTPITFDLYPLKTYYNGLTKGAPFFRNHNGEYIVVKSGFSKDTQTLYVLTKSAYIYREDENGEMVPVNLSKISEKINDKDIPHSLVAITFEDGLFVHEKLESGFHPTEILLEIFDNYTQSIK